MRKGGNKKGGTPWRVILWDEAETRLDPFRRGNTGRLLVTG